jgi:hypothetical protein
MAPNTTTGGGHCYFIGILSLRQSARLSPILGNSYAFMDKMIPLRIDITAVF